jgi:hypothetical protein
MTGEDDSGGGSGSAAAAPHAQDDCECAECGSSPKPRQRQRSKPAAPTASPRLRPARHALDDREWQRALAAEDPAAAAARQRSSWAAAAAAQDDRECHQCGSSLAPSLVLPRATSAAAAAAAEASAQAYGEKYSDAQQAARAAADSAAEAAAFFELAYGKKYYGSHAAAALDVQEALMAGRHALASGETSAIAQTSDILVLRGLLLDVKDILAEVLQVVKRAEPGPRRRSRSLHR